MIIIMGGEILGNRHKCRLQKNGKGFWMQFDWFLESVKMSEGNKEYSGLLIEICTKIYLKLKGPGDLLKTQLTFG